MKKVMLLVVASLAFTMLLASAAFALFPETIQRAQGTVWNFNSANASVVNCTPCQNGQTLRITNNETITYRFTPDSKWQWITLKHKGDGGYLDDVRVVNESNGNVILFEDGFTANDSSYDEDVVFPEEDRAPDGGARYFSGSNDYTVKVKYNSLEGTDKVDFQWGELTYGAPPPN